MDRYGDLDSQSFFPFALRLWGVASDRMTIPSVNPIFSWYSSYKSLSPTTTWLMRFQRVSAFPSIDKATTVSWTRASCQPNTPAHVIARHKHCLLFSLAAYLHSVAQSPEHHPLGRFRAELLVSWILALQSHTCIQRAFSLLISLIVGAL